MLPLDVFELVWPYYTQKQSLLKPYSFCKYHYLGQFLFTWINFRGFEFYYLQDYLMKTCKKSQFCNVLSTHLDVSLQS